MPINRRELSGKSCSEAHVPDFLDFIDSLETRIASLETGLPPGVPGDEFSDLGVVVPTGAPIAAGTPSPARAGRIQLMPAGGIAYQTITGTLAAEGDVFLVSFAGSKGLSPNLPATAKVSIAGPGDPVFGLAAGEIQIGMDSANPDASPISWLIVKKGS